MKGILKFVALNDAVRFDMKYHDDTGQYGPWLDISTTHQPRIQRDVTKLEAQETERLLEDALRTELFQFQAHGDPVDRALRLGVVTEGCPSYLSDDEGRSLSPVASRRAPRSHQGVGA